MKIEPLITVKDVQLSSRFYQETLGLQSGHGGDEYEMLMSGGELVLQLHHQDAHDHPGMWEPNLQEGNGVVLWFRTPDFETAVEKIRAVNAQIVAEPHINPNAQQYEIWFHDPDGYLVVVSSEMGSTQMKEDRNRP